MRRPELPYGVIYQVILKRTRARPGRAGALGRENRGVMEGRRTAVGALRPRDAAPATVAAATGVPRVFLATGATRP